MELDVITASVSSPGECRVCEWCVCARACVWLCVCVCVVCVCVVCVCV